MNDNQPRYTHGQIVGKKMFLWDEANKEWASWPVTVKGQTHENDAC